MKITTNNTNLLNDNKSEINISIPYYTVEAHTEDHCDHIINTFDKNEADSDYNEPFIFTEDKEDCQVVLSVHNFNINLNNDNILDFMNRYEIFELEELIEEIKYQFIETFVYDDHDVYFEVIKEYDYKA